RQTLLIGLFLFAAGMAWAAATTTIASLVGAGIAVMIGGGLATPALQSLVASQAREDERGAVMGLSQAASALGRVTGPSCAGALFEHIGVFAPFAFSSLLLVAAFLTALFFAKPQPLDSV